MSDFTHRYCRFCEQTLLTNRDATKCDLCGKVGGMTDPGPILAAKARAGIEEVRAKEEQKRLRKEAEKLDGLLFRGEIIALVRWVGVVALLFGVGIPLAWLFGRETEWQWPSLLLLPLGVGLLLAARGLEGVWTITSTTRRITKERDR